MKQLNYFELFELLPSFDLDLNQLDQSYFKAQLQFHPDRLSLAKEDNKQSLLINNAYQILKSPLKRAQYLLFLEDIIVNSSTDDNIKADSKILLDILNKKEALMEIKNIKELIEFKQQAEINYNQLLITLSEAFSNKFFIKAAQLTIELKFSNTLINEINQQQKSYETS